MKNDYSVYIQTVLQSLLDKERHQEIKDELMDHMLSLEEDMEEKQMDLSEIKDQVLKEMGSPIDLGKDLNRIYGMNQKPLFLVGICSFLLVLLNGFIMLQFGMSKPSQMIAIFLSLLINLICLGVVIRIKRNLDQVRLERIYFSGYPKTNIKKLTDKVFVYGGGIFILLIIGLSVYDFLTTGLESDILMMINMYGSYFLIAVLYMQYPKMIFSENGVYMMRDFPKFISWEEADGYEWKQKFGTYQMRLKNKKWSGKVYTGFDSREKELVNFFYKKQKK